VEKPPDPDPRILRKLKGQLAWNSSFFRRPFLPGRWFPRALSAMPCRSFPTSPAASVFPCVGRRLCMADIPTGVPDLRPLGISTPGDGSFVGLESEHCLFDSANCYSTEIARNTGFWLSRFSFRHVQSDLANCKTTFFGRLESAPNMPICRPDGHLTVLKSPVLRPWRP
jgi:hypothetical protein